MNILEQTWGGNSFLRWGIAIGLLLMMPIVLKIADVLVSRQTKFKDGLRGKWLSPLLQVMRKPLLNLIRFTFLWILVQEVIIIPSRIHGWLVTGIYLSVVLIGAWLAADLAEKVVDIATATTKAESDNNLLRPIFRRFASIAACVVILIGGLDHGGYDVRAILAGLGIGGLAIAMASKDLLSDILGGLYIMINRPFAVGDRIIYKDKWAVVLEFGLRTTTLRDFDINHKIIVPNGQFTNYAMVNVSDHPGSMILMNIRLSLTNDIDKIAEALDLVQHILKNHSEVRYIWSKLDHFDDYAFTLRIHYDILEFKHRVRVKSEVNLAIAKAFQTHGIKFAAMPVRALQADASDNAFVA
jgi:MscS family membrane protein